MTLCPPERPSVRLRRAVLAASLRDRGALADLTVSDEGVTLPTLQGETLQLSWDELGAAAGDADRAGKEASLERRIARWLRLRVVVSDLICLRGTDGLIAAARPLALPRGHALHPGDAWLMVTILGGCLDVGLGLRGVDDDGRWTAEAVGLLPIELLHAAGIDPSPAVARADRYLREMATLAAERLLRSPSAVLRPLGDCDVVTLLASPVFRRAIVRDSGGVVGMCSAAVPVRRRGWLDLGRVDPAFALAAASLTDPDERGFPRPLLVTEEEIVQVREGGSPVRFALSDPPAPDPAPEITRIV